MERVLADRRAVMKEAREDAFHGNYLIESHPRVLQTASGQLLTEM